MPWYDEPDDRVDSNYTPTNTQLQATLERMGVNVPGSSGSSTRGAPQQPVYIPTQNTYDTPSRSTSSRSTSTRGAPQQPVYIPTQNTYDTPSRSTSARSTSIRSVPQQPTYIPTQNTYDTPSRQVNTLRPAAVQLDKQREEFLFEQNRQRVSTGGYGDVERMTSPAAPAVTVLDEGYQRSPYTRTPDPNAPTVMTRSQFVGDNLQRQWETTWERVVNDWADTPGAGEGNYYPVLQPLQQLNETAQPIVDQNQRILSRAAELRDRAIEANPSARFAASSELGWESFITQAEKELGYAMQDTPGIFQKGMAVGKGLVENLGQVPYVGTGANVFGNTLMTIAEGLGFAPRMAMQLAVPINENAVTPFDAIESAVTGDTENLQFITLGQDIGALTDTLLNPDEWLSSPAWSNGNNPISAFNQAWGQREQTLVDQVYSIAPRVGETYTPGPEADAAIERRATATVLLDFSGQDAAADYISFSANREAELERLRKSRQGAYAASHNMNLTPEQRQEHALNAAQLELQIKTIENASEQELADMFMNPWREAVLAAVTDVTFLKDIAKWGVNIGEGILESGTAANPVRRRLVKSLELAEMADDEVARVTTEIASEAIPQRSIVERAWEGGLSRVSYEQHQTRSAVSTLFSAVEAREDIPVILNALGDDIELAINRGIPVQDLHSPGLVSMAQDGFVRIPEADALLIQASAKEIGNNIRAYAGQWQNMLSLRDAKASIYDITDEVLRHTQLASAERNNVSRLANLPPIGTATVRIEDSANAAGDLVHAVEYVDSGGTVLSRSAWGTRKAAEAEMKVYNAAVKAGEFVQRNPLDDFSSYLRNSISIPLIYARPGSWVRNAAGGWLTAFATASNTMTPVDDVLAFVNMAFPAGAPYEYLKEGATSAMFSGKGVLSGKSWIQWARSVRGGHTEIRGTNIAFGENAFKAKTWYKGAQELTRTVTNTAWRTTIEPSLVELGVPVSTRNFVQQSINQLAKDWDINRFIDNVTQFAVGRRKDVDIASFGRHYEEVLPSAVRQSISDLVESSDNAEDLAIGISGILDNEIGRLAGTAGYVADEATVPVNLTNEIANVLRDVNEVGRRISSTGGDMTSVVTAQRQMQSIAEATSRMYLLAARAKSAEAVELMMGYFRDLDVARRDVFMALDDLSRQIAASSNSQALKLEYDQLKARYWAEFGDYGVQRGQDTIQAMAGLESSPRRFAVGATDLSLPPIDDMLGADELAARELQGLNELADQPPVDMAAAYETYMRDNPEAVLSPEQFAEDVANGDIALPDQPVSVTPVVEPAPRLRLSDNVQYAEWRDLTAVDFSGYKGRDLFGDAKTSAINDFRQVKQMHWQQFYNAADATGDVRAVDVMLQAQQDISRITAETKARLKPLKDAMNAAYTDDVAEEVAQRRGLTQSERARDKGSAAYQEYRRQAKAYYTAQANEEYDLAVRTSAKIQAATAYIQSFPEPVAFVDPVYGNVTVLSMRGDTAAVRIAGGNITTMRVKDLPAEVVTAAENWIEGTRNIGHNIDDVAIPGMNQALDTEIKNVARQYLEDLATSRERAGIANPAITDSVADSILLLSDMQNKALEIARTAFDTTATQLNPAQLNGVIDAANSLRKQWGRIKGAAAIHGDKMQSFHMIDFTRRYRPDQIASLFFPYHTFTTRTGKNLVERMVSQSTVRHAMDVEGAYFEQQNGDPAKQYTEVEIGGKKLRFYASISGYTMGVYDWAQADNFYEQQQLDGPFGAAYAIEKNVGTGMYPFIDALDAGARDPYWNQAGSQWTAGGVAGVVARAGAASFGQMPFGQTFAGLVQSTAGALGLAQDLPSGLITSRMVDDISRRLAAAVQNGDISETQALYAGAVLHAAANGQPLPPQMAPEQIQAAEKLLNGTVLSQGINSLVTRLTSDVAGLTTVNLTPGRSNLPRTEYNASKPGDISQMPQAQYSAYRTKLTTLENAGVISESDAERLRSWLQSARSGKPGALPTSLAPALQILNERLQAQSDALRRADLQSGVPAFAQTDTLGLTEAQSLYANVGYPENVFGGKQAQAAVREANPGITTYWMRYNIKEGGESPAVQARRTEYFDATNEIYRAQADEVTAYIIENSGRYVTNDEVKAIRSKYSDRLNELRDKYGDALEGTSFEPSTEGMNPHERALYELESVLNYNDNKPAYPTEDMTPEEKVAAYAARDKWESARLDYIERTMEQYALTENPVEWVQILNDYAQGEYASELVRKYISLKYAGQIEKRWDAFSSIEREMDAYEYVARDDNILLRLGDDVLKKYRIYENYSLEPDANGVTPRKQYADDNPEIVAARVAGYNPQAYDAGVELFGKEMWVTLAAYRKQKPTYPGQDADAKDLAAYYDKLNALNARYPQAQEIQFWVDGRYRWWEAWGDQANRTAVDEFYKEGGYGQDYALAQELFGEDIFEVWQGIPRSTKTKQATARYYAAHPELEGFNAWKSQYSEMPENANELQRFDVNAAEAVARAAGQLNAPVPASFAPTFTYYQGPRPIGSDRQPINETAEQKAQRLVLEANYRQLAANETAQQQAIQDGAAAIVSDPPYTIDPYTGRSRSYGGGGGYSSSGRRYYGGGYRRSYGGGGGGYYSGGSGYGLQSPQIRRLYPDRVELQNMNPILWQSLLSRYYRPGA